MKILIVILLFMVLKKSKMFEMFGCREDCNTTHACPMGETNCRPYYMKASKCRSECSITSEKRTNNKGNKGKKKAAKKKAAKKKAAKKKNFCGKKCVRKIKNCLKKNFIKTINCDAEDEEIYNACPIARRVKNEKRKNNIYNWFVNKCTSQNKASDSSQNKASDSSQNKASRTAATTAATRVTEKPAQEIDCDPTYLCNNHTKFRKALGTSSSKKCREKACKGPNKNVHAKTELWLKNNYKNKNDKEKYCWKNYHVYDGKGGVSCSK